MSDLCFYCPGSDAVLIPRQAVTTIGGISWASTKKRQMPHCWPIWEAGPEFNHDTQRGQTVTLVDPLAFGCRQITGLGVHLL